MKNLCSDHHAFNTLDQNAVIDPHTRVRINGLSSHGFQQSPAMGRGMAALLVYRSSGVVLGGSAQAGNLCSKFYTVLAFGYLRVGRGESLLEKAVIRR